MNSSCNILSFSFVANFFAAWTLWCESLSTRWISLHPIWNCRFSALIRSSYLLHLFSDYSSLWSYLSFCAWNSSRTTSSVGPPSSALVFYSLSLVRYLTFVGVCLHAADSEQSLSTCQRRVTVVNKRLIRSFLCLTVALSIALWRAAGASWRN